MESTNLIPLDGDMSRITRKAEEFKEYHDALQRNLQTYLTLTMDGLSGVHQRTKASLIPDSARQMVCNSVFTPLRSTDSRWQSLGGLRRKSRSLMIFAGILKYRMSSDVYSYLARLDVEIAL